MLSGPRLDPDSTNRRPHTFPNVLVSPSLGVKAKANKLNSPRINWRCRLSIGIRLFFRFNIVASKEYYLTIIGSLKV